MVRTYYINGLNGYVPPVYIRRVLTELKLRGLVIEHIPVDWYGNETLYEAIARVGDCIRGDLGRGHRVVLVGVSAGGSLAVNVLKELKSSNLFVVLLSSRVNEMGLSCYDWRTLDRMARVGTSRPSNLFRASVLASTRVAMGLTASEKSRVLVVKGMSDEVVPIATTDIPKGASVRLATFWHRQGLKVGLSRADQLISLLLQSP